MESMENPPQTELVKIEISGSTCHITLDREEKYNALNVQMITELCMIFLVRNFIKSTPAPVLDHVLWFVTLEKVFMV